MGGAVKDTVGALLAPFTGGASLKIGPDTAGLANKTPGGAVANVGQPVYDSVSGKTTRNAINASNSAMNASMQAQADQAAALQKQLLLQPKSISPDNFLSMKNGQLANLRLGLASTITGAGGSPSAVVSSPSLAAGGAGKSKFGQ